MKRFLTRTFWSFLPHADRAVAARLLRLGQYRKWANYLLVEFQMARGHSLMLGRPYWLTVDPTNFCQLQCPFCPTGAGRGVRDKAALKLEHFDRLLAELGPYVVHLDVMNWGEPTLNKDLPGMLACAKRHQIEIKMDTNLNDASDAMLEGLIRSGLDVLSVSIDGATQEAYQKYRVGGNLERVLENVRRLLRKKKELGSATPRVIWQFIVFKHNEHEVERARETAASLGMDDFSLVSAFMPNEPKVLAAWLPSVQEHRLYAPPPAGVPVASDPLDVVRIQESTVMRSYRTRRFEPGQLRSARSLGRWRADVWLRAWTALRRPDVCATAAVPFTGAPPQPICKWPWAGMTVNPNGSVAPCCSVEDQGDDFGSIFAGGFTGLWNGAKYRRSRRHVSRYARGKAPVLPGSDHVCERCTAIGYVNFRFPSGSV